MAITDRALPYIERLLDDRELQRDLRDAITALRGGYGRAENKRRKPSRLLGDKKFKQSAQQAATSLRDATMRVRGEPPKSHRGRKFVVAVVVIGAVAIGARALLKGQEATTQVP
jgi:hypothetical protein